MTLNVEHHYATVNGVKLHFASAGKGPLMLFVHGFPEFWYAWKHQLAEFARDHRAVAPDTRGINLSEKPADVKAYRPKHLVEDLRQLIDHLGGKPCVVVAHDWGGAVAWNLAIEHPSYISKLVIINSPHPIPYMRALTHDPEQIAASQYMVTFREPGAEQMLSADNFEALASVLRSFGTDDAKWMSDADLALYREAWSRPGALTAGLNYYRASPLHPASPQDPGAAALSLDPRRFTVTVPTLVIWGERDNALRPVLLEGLNEVVPNLTVKRIPKGSHWVIHEYPEQVNQLIREFIGAD